MEIGAVEIGGVVGGEVVAGKRGKTPQGWKCMPFIIGEAPVPVISFYVLRSV